MTMTILLLSAGRLKMQLEEYSKAEECLKDAVLLECPR